MGNSPTRDDANKDSGIPSRTALRRLQRSPRPSSSPLGRVAFVVGNQDYEHFQDLEGCKHDANAFAEYLKEHQGFGDENFPDLDPHHTCIPTGKRSDSGVYSDLTYGEMIEGMKELLLSRCHGGDLLVFYYSGHGGRRRESDMLEHDIRETLVPVDSSYALESVEDGGSENRDISELMLRAWVFLLREKGVHVMMVLDSCHSGELLRDVSGKSKSFGVDRRAPTDQGRDQTAWPDWLCRADGTPLTPKEAENLPGVTVNRGCKEDGDGGFVLLAACRGDQRAYEAAIIPNTKMVVGVFTHLLLDVLKTWKTKFPRTPLTYTALQHCLLAEFKERNQEPVVRAKSGNVVFNTDDKERGPRKFSIRATRVRSRGQGRKVEVRLEAGELSGIREGSQLDLFSLIDVAMTESRARVKVTHVRPETATAEGIVGENWVGEGEDSFRACVHSEVSEVFVKVFVDEEAELQARATSNWPEGASLHKLQELICDHEDLLPGDVELPHSSFFCNVAEIEEADVVISLRKEEGREGQKRFFLIVDRGGNPLTPKLDVQEQAAPGRLASWVAAIATSSYLVRLNNQESKLPPPRIVLQKVRDDAGREVQLRGGDFQVRGSKGVLPAEPYVLQVQVKRPEVYSRTKMKVVIFHIDQTHFVKCVKSTEQKNVEMGREEWMVPAFFDGEDEENQAWWRGRPAVWKVLFIVYEGNGNFEETLKTLESEGVQLQSTKGEKRRCVRKERSLNFCTFLKNRQRTTGSQTRVVDWVCADSKLTVNWP